MVELSVSQSPQTGQFNSYYPLFLLRFWLCIESQSPQTGQFNSYGNIARLYHMPAYRVSIPSNGSIQFLPYDYYELLSAFHKVSQSPQTGQFNSYNIHMNRYLFVLTYVSIPSNGSIQFLPS